MSFDPVAIQAELEALLHDFYRSYTVDGDGDFGLTFRLHARHLDPPTHGDEEKTAKAKPESRAPGDLNALSLAEEVSEAVRYWTRKVHPAGVTPVLGDCLKLLPLLAGSNDFGDQILFELRSIHRRSLFALELDEAPEPIRGVACPLCGGHTIVRDMRRPDLGLWCNAGGTEGCHNDEAWPSCRALCPTCGEERRPWCTTCAGQLGLLLCRHSPGSLRHAKRWGFNELDELVRSAAA